MTKITNKELLNAIRNDSSAEYKNNIPYATDTNSLDIHTSLLAYPTSNNEFINTLTNKIGKEMFFNKVFNNPYKMLHRGMLPIGASIEQLFVEMAEQKGFGENFTGGSSNEANLITPLKPTVKADYISKNFHYKFKTSVSDEQIKMAFTTQYGLHELLNRVVNSLLSAVEYSEFKDMKKILSNGTQDASGGSSIDKGVIQKVAESLEIKGTAVVPLGASFDGRKFAKIIRTYANKLTFPSNKYNLAQVTTWSKKEDLILFTTPEIQAELDVEVLANAFNVSSAEVNIRTILVDDLGMTGNGTGKEVVGVLADKDLIQAYDIVNTTNTFYNPERLATNYFAHKQGIIACCAFANSIVFIKGDALED